MHRRIGQSQVAFFFGARADCLFSRVARLGALVPRGELGVVALVRTAPLGRAVELIRIDWGMEPHHAVLLKDAQLGARSRRQFCVVALGHLVRPPLNRDRGRCVEVFGRFNQHDDTARPARSETSTDHRKLNFSLGRPIPRMALRCAMPRTRRLSRVPKRSVALTIG